jgi:carbon storage regulator
MLVLSRKRDESIIIGETIEIKVIDVKNGIVKIGISAPKQIPVRRKEIQKIIEENRNATNLKLETLPLIFKILGENP